MVDYIAQVLSWGIQHLLGQESSTLLGQVAGSQQFTGTAEILKGFLMIQPITLPFI